MNGSENDSLVMVYGNAGTVNLIKGVVRLISDFIVIACYFPAGVFAQTLFTTHVCSETDSSKLDYVSYQVRYRSGGQSKTIHGYSKAGGEINFNAIAPFSLLLYARGYKSQELDVSSVLQQKIYLKKLKVELKEATVSTAQANQVTRDASLYKVNVIDRRQIELQSASNLGDLLATQSNIRLSQDPVLGSSLSIGGLSGQNIKILIDGIPVIGRENGNINLSQINLSNIEQVEIIEGPLSSVYGADALGGVINLISKSNAEEQFSGSLNARYETVGNYNLDGSAAFSVNRFSSSVYGGRYFFDGYNLDADKRDQLWNPKEDIFAGLSLVQKYHKSQLKFKTDWSKETVYDRHNPVITPYEAYAFDDIYRSTRFNNALFHDYRFDSVSKLTSLVSYSVYRRNVTTNYIDLVTLNTEPVNANAGIENNFTAFNARSVYSGAKGKQWKYQYGIDLNYETGAGKKLENEFQSIGDYAAFAWAEFNPGPAFQARASFRTAYNTKYDSPFIPSLNILYHFRQHATVRASVAKGYRAPSLKELDLYFVDANHYVYGNPHLLPENSVNYQLSVEHKKYFNAFVIKVEPDVFYNDIENLILLAQVDNTTQEYTYINSGRYKTMGYGIKTVFQNNQIKFEASVHNLATYNLLSETYSIPTYSTTPEFFLSISWYSKQGGYSVGLFTKYNGAAPAFALDQNGLPYQTQMDAYTICDLTAGKSFFNNQIKLSAGIKNLFDVNNVANNNASGIPHGSTYQTPVAMGRNYFIGLAFNFNTPTHK